MSAPLSLANRPCWVAGWVLVLAVVAWAYQPGLSGPMLFDDFVNLQSLEDLDLSEQYVVDVVIGNKAGPLGRPVSMASFVLEKLYLDHGPTGQKTVGLVLHLLNGCLVLALSLSIFRALGATRPREQAILVAALWLSLPLLLSTTLYVVQRMTILSTFFTLLALLSYCQAREHLNRSQLSWPWFAAFGAAVILAMLSKENGVLAIPLATAMELFVYRAKAPRALHRKLLLAWHGSVAIGGVLAAAAILIFEPGQLLKGYEHRSFTLVERLLTQSRVLFDYLAQLLWVDVHTLGLYHDDVQKSVSLFDPGETALALLAWTIAIAGAVFSAITGRFRLMAFGLIFFLCGHAMESTFFPLELYFEHRNYLPAVGVLIALVGGGYQLQARWPVLNGWVPLFLLVLLGRNLLMLGSQAVIWSDTRLLHIEAANHHPNSERAQLELAGVFALDGSIDAAIARVEGTSKLVHRSAAEDAVLKASYYCMAATPFPESLFSMKTPERDSLRSLNFGNYMENLTRLVLTDGCTPGDGERFAQTMSAWIRDAGGDAATGEILESMILLHNHLGMYPEAMEYVTQLIDRYPDNVMGLQFALYLSYVLDDPRGADAAAQKLLALRDSGRLTKKEADNLELFLSGNMATGE